MRLCITQICVYAEYVFQVAPTLHNAKTSMHSRMLGLRLQNYNMWVLQIERITQTRTAAKVLELRVY
jgi:hypothetical protein